MRSSPTVTPSSMALSRPLLIESGALEHQHGPGRAMMSDDPVARILTINSGSSSLKFALFHLGRSDTPLLSGRMDRIGLGNGVFHVTGVGGATEIDRRLDLADHD